MTTPDIASLCERLRAEAAALRRWIGDRADARTWGGPTMYPPHPITEDNAAAIIANATKSADALERQAAEIERLRGALRFYADEHEYPSDGPWGVNSDDFGKRARAALTGEDHD